MFSLKGFASFAGFANNAIGQVSLIGELSSTSLTFAKDKGILTNINYKDIVLTSFSSKEDDEPTPATQSQQDSLFDVVGWIYTQMLNSNTTQDKLVFLTAISDYFAGNISNVEFGVIINYGDNYIPEWVSWNYGEGGDFFRIWFSDASFQAQYDEYEIIVIPALENLDNFFLQATEVDARLGAMTTSKIVDRMQAAKENYPETVMKVETFDYIAPGNPNYKVPSRWGVLIYGNAGNNIDSIKDALTKYILDHSGHLRADWIDILPDLFKRTEFVFMPVWDNYAIPNRTLEAGIYSPLINPAYALDKFELIVTFYLLAHIKNVMDFLTYPYKSLGMVVVGGPENREGKFHLTDFYPDFIAINTASIDFNRMSPETQEFANDLATMIYLAENTDKYTILPFGYTKLVRDNIIYVVKTINNVQFLVVTKHSFENVELLP